MNIPEIRRKILLIYQQTDAVIEKFPSCCKRGCSFCCHQNIRIGASEEFTITNYLHEKVGLDVKQKIKNQLIAWLDYFNNVTPSSRVLEENDIQVFESQIAKDRIPCFFLISGECSIYPARPLVCRTHIVESYPEKCDSDRRRDSIPITKDVRQQKAFELIKTFPINSIRLLAYSVTDYFGLKMHMKPITMRVLTSDKKQ